MSGELAAPGKKERLMFRKLLLTDGGFSSFILRIALGVVMFPHGAQKVLGWFGGQGFLQTVDQFTRAFGLPVYIIYLVMAAELLGSLGLIVGFLTRIAAFGIFCVMFGAIVLVHFQNGFFMNWTGTQSGEGFEYHIVVIAMALVLMIKGGGFFSFDHGFTGPPDRKR
jgi:putative oxidoreductase